MPCYTVQLASVEFKAKYRRVLDEALKRLSWRFGRISDGSVHVPELNGTIDLENQKATIPEYNQDKLNQLKREYSAIVLEQVAKKKRWVLKKESANKAILRRY